MQYRGLSEKNILKLKNEFSFIIDFLKEEENNDVFLGIRNNYINIFVDGGSLLKVDLNKNIANINIGYFKDDSLNIADEEQLSKVNKRKLDALSIDIWINLLPTLKEKVKKYQNNSNGNLTKRANEQILQQNIINYINKQNNSRYFAYDLEYNLEGIKDYVYDSFKNKTNNKPKTLGRSDIMIIELLSHDKINLHFMEVKYGINAFSGVNAGKQTLGSGIVGHIKNYVPIINHINTNKIYKSLYYENKEFDIKDIINLEIKRIMKAYQDLGLLKNSIFREIDYKEIKINKAYLSFYLGNCHSINSFFNHLGISENGNAKFSVKSLLNKESSAYKELNLDFIDKNEMIDFYYYIENNGVLDIDIHQFQKISKEIF